MFLALILTAMLVLLTYKWLRRPSNFPPGPTGLPVIGAIHITRGSPHTVCHDLVKTYGPIIGLKFASRWGIVLHDVKLIRETFGDLAASGRRETEGFTFIIGDKHGILQASGEIWSEQRRFAMRTLRDFGFGKASMEEMILDEVEELVDWLKKQGGRPVELKRRFSLAVVNSLWRILTGERYAHDDPALMDILDKLDSTQHELRDFRSPMKATILFHYPKIAKFLANYSGWTKLTESSKSRTDMFDRIIEEHSQTLEKENSRDFVDVYLHEVNKTANQNSSFHSSIGKQSLRSVISDLFFAGSDTTSTTLQWTVVYLLHHPEVLEKMQKELDVVLGTRQPTLNDKKKLPYLECVIMEVMRYSSILPFGVGHMTVQDMKVGGYDIPKGTMVNANLYHVHHDPEIWGDPESFRPERFLNPDGTCMGRHEALMAFSVGRRLCMGENLARDTIFLFVATLVHNFSMDFSDEENDKVSMAATVGQITLQPRPFKVSMKCRM